MKKIFILFSGIVLSIHGYSQSWSITGNTGTNPATNFLGSSDTASLVLRTDNIQRMIVLGNGNVGIGTLAPTANLGIFSSTADHHLQLEGTAPSVALINGTNGANTSARLAYSTATNDYVGGSVVNDLILSNYDSVASLILATNNSAGNGIERMRINKFGYIGIDKPSPTARLDVNCATLSGQTNPSNIRFESLQSGTGTELVIDSNGYVYAASSAQVVATPLATDMQNQIEELKNQVQELRSLLTSKVPLTTAEAASLNAESTTWLNGIYPNPANTSATIEYSLPAGAGTAICQVYSVSGQPITSVVLPASSGKSQVQLSTSQLPAGMYICALVVNGKVLDSKSLAVVR